MGAEKPSVYKKAICLCLAVLLLLFAVGCGQKIPDYGAKGEYEDLFTEEDTDNLRMIKSFVIWHLELFNDDDYAAYAAQYYGLEENEQKAQIEALKTTGEQVTTRKTPVYLSAVFLDTDTNRAQVGAVVRTVVTDKEGNTVADYTDRVTYALYRSDGEWTIEEETIENVGFYE